MKTLPKLGDTLWLHFTENKGNTLRPYVVSKIGHKWITVHIADAPHVTYRVAVSDGRIDGGVYSSPGTAYSSVEECEAVQAAKSAWSDLREAVRSSNVPAGLSAETINQAIALLKV